MATFLQRPDDLHPDLRLRSAPPRPPPSAWAGRYVPPPGAYSQQVIVYGSMPTGAKMQTMSGKPVQQYLQQGAGFDGQDATLFTRPGQAVDMERFLRQTATDPHQFRLSISPKHAPTFFAMQPYIETLMERVERDLGQRLDWVAAVHRNTERLHAHVLIRGRTAPARDPAQLELRLAVLHAELAAAGTAGLSTRDLQQECAKLQRELDGDPLYIQNDYLAHGLRHRASQIATWQMGPDRDKVREQHWEKDTALAIRQATSGQQLDQLMTALIDERVTPQTGETYEHTALRYTALGDHTRAALLLTAARRWHELQHHQRLPLQHRAEQHRGQELGL